MGEVDVYMARAFVALLVVILLALAAWLVVRRRPYLDQRLRSRHLELLEALPIGPQGRLLLVRVGERTLLLGATLQSVSFLTEVNLRNGHGSASPRNGDVGDDGST